MASGVHRRNERSRSKRMLCTKIVHLAEKFQGERFFVVQNVDFRGVVILLILFFIHKAQTFAEGY